MATVSVPSIMYRTAVYPTNELLQSFVPNDVFSFFVGWPILLGSMGLSRRPARCDGRSSRRRQPSPDSGRDAAKRHPPLVCIHEDAQCITTGGQT